MIDSLSNFLSVIRGNSAIRQSFYICSLMFASIYSIDYLIYQPNLVRVAQLNVSVSQNITSLENKHPYQSLNFAKEKLPVNNPKVSYRMWITLKQHKSEGAINNELHQGAQKWFPVIEPILKDYGIPEDFKYVPLVESGFQKGISTKGAAGYWQFMPGTARTYGLKVNTEIDERQNMHKSTVAACKYLRSMYSQLKNWTLVAAAYNIGDTRLRKQMRNQNETNYFKLKLNRETAMYVYKLISMKQVIENSNHTKEVKPKIFAMAETGNSGRFMPIHNHLLKF